MQVVDIVNRAALNCGVASSFNPDEVPEDIQARASDIFRHEIIPMINCDRTLDITEIVYPATAQRGVISLRTPPINYENVIVAQVDMTYNEMREKASYLIGLNSGYYYPNLRSWLITNGYITPDAPSIYNKTEKWPTTQFVGAYRKIYAWSSDYKLVNLSEPTSLTANLDDDLLDDRYNIPFAPMRITAIVRAGDGAIMKYLHAEELISSEYRHAHLVYGIEDLPDRLVVRFNPNFSGESVQIVIPIPLKIVNSLDEPNPWQGTLIAPEKFRAYLIAKLAYRLAVEYGLDTAPLMMGLAKESYSSLIKNLSKKEHAQDIPRRINQYLQRGHGWGRGYGGGFNG